MDKIQSEDMIKNATFSRIDYCVFGLMLSLSAVIGVYHAIRDKKNPEQFLMAGKSMSSFPVAMSLVASFISAIGLLGIPSEIFHYGTMYLWMIVSFIIVYPIVCYLYVPVFWQLEVTSAYEYLERRFHFSIRIIGASCFIIQTVLYMAIVVHAPALALMQVTGVSYLLSISIICCVCMFYTTLGGMKAVLWTDVIQVMTISLSLAIVYIKGTFDVGGIYNVWSINNKFDRVQFLNFSTDPTVRHTVWSVLIGSIFQWTAIYGVNQTQIQRYFCLKNKRMVYQAVFINTLGMMTVIAVCGFGGMIAFAEYYQCNPKDIGKITSSDQIIPVFVMDKFKHWKGIPGLFVAGIFSGSLSTLSSGMNSLAAITLEDLIKRPYGIELTDKIATIVSMGLSLMYGLITFGLVFLVNGIGKNVISISNSVFGTVGGPFLGCFTLGMFFPCANSLGAGLGTILSLAFTFWMALGQNLASSAGDYAVQTRPFLLNGCNATVIMPQNWGVGSVFAEDLFYLYKISYLWSSPIGFFLCISLGLIISLISGGQDKATLDYKTISPLIYKIQRKFNKKSESSKKEDIIRGIEMRRKGEENPAYET